MKEIKDIFFVGNFLNDIDLLVKKKLGSTESVE
jgi:hypothetical protein